MKILLLKLVRLWVPSLFFLTACVGGGSRYDDDRLSYGELTKTEVAALKKMDINKFIEESSAIQNAPKPGFAKIYIKSNISYNPGDNATFDSETHLTKLRYAPPVTYSEYKSNSKYVSTDSLGGCNFDGRTEMSKQAIYGGLITLYANYRDISVGPCNTGYTDDDTKSTLHLIGVYDWVGDIFPLKVGKTTKFSLLYKETINEKHQASKVIYTMEDEIYTVMEKLTKKCFRNQIGDVYKINVAIHLKGRKNTYAIDENVHTVTSKIFYAEKLGHSLSHCEGSYVDDSVRGTAKYRISWDKEYKSKLESDRLAELKKEVVSYSD